MMIESDSSVKAKNTVPVWRRFLLPGVLSLSVILVIAGVGGYLRYSMQRSCSIQAVEETSDLLMNQVQRYDDVYQVATNAAPDSVVLPVSVLQQTLMDTKQIEVPGCMKTAQDELVEYMAGVIQAFDAYRERKPDATVKELIARSETHFATFAQELRQVKECAPYCFP